MLASRLVKRFKCAAPAVKSGRNAKTLRTAPAPSARPTVVSRSFLGSDLIRGRTNSNQEFAENPKGVPSYVFAWIFIFCSLHPPASMGSSYNPCLALTKYFATLF